MKLTTGLATIACMQFLIFSNGFNHVEGRRGFGGSEQEWGFVKVRPYANMFWWLYYTTADVSDVHEKPLLIWLQGGPGASSSGYGNFEELGPLDLDLKPRNFTWVNDYNVLFIDNPVGAGYSYAERTSGYALNNTQIALDLLECMKGFYGEAPKWLSVPVYITSESYGGKMAADFAIVWNKAEIAGELQSNLKGVVMIDSWISPIESVLSWAPFLLHTGMVDTKGYNKIQAAASETKSAVDYGKWDDATSLWGYTERVVLENTINIDFYNILYKVDGGSRLKTAFQPILPSARDDSDARLSALMNNQVKKALNISGSWGSQSGIVFRLLYPDFMKPVTKSVEYLLDKTDIEVFVLTGQLDLIVATPGTVAWVEKLKWKNSEQWRSAPRLELVVEDVIEGYLKQYGRLKVYWVNRSGHMVPRDNPAATAAILEHLMIDEYS